MPEPTVRTSSRLWSEEVAIARAVGGTDLDGIASGGVAALLDTQTLKYEFSGARKFSERTPYQ